MLNICFYLLILVCFNFCEWFEVCNVDFIMDNSLLEIYENKYCFLVCMCIY